MYPPAMLKFLDFMKLLCCFSVAALASLLLSACPSKPKSSGNLRRVVAMGDPMNIVKGATLSPQLPMDFFKGTSRLYMFAGVDFVERATYEAKPVSQESAEQENAATSENSAENVKNIEFFVYVDAARSSSVSLKTMAFSLAMVAPAGGGGVDLKITTESGASVKGELLHASVSSDGNILSLLLKANDPAEGVVLMAMYFAKKISPDVPVPKGNSKFYYNYGPGVKVRWPKDKKLKFNICGERAIQEERVIREQIQKWQLALGRRLEIEVAPQRNYAPFNDLNQNCLFFIDDHLADPDPRYSNYGITLSIVDFKRSVYIDSDILLFNEEFEKVGVPYKHPDLYENFKYTVLHEFGHVLGLDHMFDGEPSVMSYDFDEARLFNYDREAIRALYE